MLQYLRSCQRSLLVNMSYKQYRHSARLGKAKQGGSTLAHLGDTSRRRIDVLCRDGLYGVDNHHLWLHVLDVVEYALERCLGKNQKIVVQGVGCWVLDVGRVFCVSAQRSVLNIQQSLSPHLQLLGALLTANIQHALVFQVEYCLQSERALAYTRLTSQQHYASLYESSAKHAV